MIVLQRQATVASGAKFGEALAFSDQVTKLLGSKFPDKAFKQWLQLGGDFATIHWTVEFDDMADFEIHPTAHLTVQAWMEYNDMTFAPKPIALMRRDRNGKLQVWSWHVSAESAKRAIAHAVRTQAVR